jgi:hypothetical protein
MSLHEHERFIGRVIDVNDPDKSGRVKIRIYGLQDDTNRIKDDDLPWVRCIFPVTNPVHDGVAGGTTGLIKDATVVGYFADSARQIPLISGTLGGLTDKESDFPKADRGEDFNDVLKSSLPSIGESELKHSLDKTIGNIKFVGQDISALLDAIGEGDILSAVLDAVNIISDFKALKDNIVGSTIDSINGIVQGFASDAGQLLQGAVGNVVETSGLGNVIQTVQDVSGGAGNITDTINHLAGNIAPRTSKNPITTVDDALTRVNGSKFVMENVMPHLDASLNKLIEINT